MVWRLMCVVQFYILLGIYTYLGLTPHPEHFAGYCVAAVSISFARPLWPLWQRAVFLLAYSVFIEIGQHFNPPRTFSGMDILANGSGVLMGLMTVTLLEKTISPFAKLLYWKTNMQRKSHGINN